MSNAPLAERMRPKKLSDYAGQHHVVGAKGALQPALDQKRLPSLLFWGPPGVGKTTLAQLLAEQVDMPFTAISAISSGVKEVREVIQRAEKDRMFHPRGRVLFIDEIHRFSKSQQDALLAAVEKGTITLIGATTENPSFEVNSALLSRCQLFVLKSLEEEELIPLGIKAISSDEFLKSTAVSEVNFKAIYGFTGGDARRFLNTLESLCLVAKNDGRSQIDSDFVLEHAPKMAPKYDRAGEQHYDIASALIKSIRGSDPQATVYWLARMIAGGESPTFIARRLLIAAAEDVGLANPNALTVATACFHAVERLGMPEGRNPLSECAIYLASSPKSNRAYLAINAALKEVQQSGDLEVPLHLRNAPTQTMKDLGYGEAYRYPHDFPGSFVSQNYLPKGLFENQFYTPGENPTEVRISEWLNARWSKES
ncbi:MAG: replication-associated recombination protein A [Schleiferiaceae bacterium]|nr:replication-associated recombination protein A [Schleiferiaceae bacterium]